MGPVNHIKESGFLRKMKGASEVYLVGKSHNQICGFKRSSEKKESSVWPVL